jgi:hypothetical protein
MPPKKKVKEEAKEWGIKQFDAIYCVGGGCVFFRTRWATGEVTDDPWWRLGFVSAGV